MRPQPCGGLSSLPQSSWASLLCLASAPSLAPLASLVRTRGAGHRAGPPPCSLASSLNARPRSMAPGTVVLLAGGAIKGCRAIADWPGLKPALLRRQSVPRVQRGEADAGSCRVTAEERHDASGLCCRRATPPSSARRRACRPSRPSAPSRAGAGSSRRRPCGP